MQQYISHDAPQIPASKDTPDLIHCSVEDTVQMVNLSVTGMRSVSQAPRPYGNPAASDRNGTLPQLKLLVAGDRSNRESMWYQLAAIAAHDTA
jgi:hypothetical protein